MGVLNVSPESFHAGSVFRRDDDLLHAALAMAEAGAALIDVGARSTAPYLPTEISEADERERLVRAVELLAGKLPVPVSADTARPAPARAALEGGARVINDVSGLRDPAVAALVAQHHAGVILVSSPVSAQGLGGDHRADPVARVRELLGEALERARAAGIADERIVVDPGIGFFRDEGVPWDVWDARVLAGLGALRTLGRPLCVGVSRKSFIGALTGRESAGERLAGSLAAAGIAVWGGAALLRTHDVAETLDAVRVAERLRNAARTL
jgi:dihydropteroate synthase